MVIKCVFKSAIKKLQRLKYKYHLMLLNVTFSAIIYNYKNCQQLINLHLPCYCPYIIIILQAKPDSV